MSLTEGPAGSGLRERGSGSSPWKGPAGPSNLGSAMPTCLPSRIGKTTRMRPSCCFSRKRCCAPLGAGWETRWGWAPLQNSQSLGRAHEGCPGGEAILWVSTDTGQGPPFSPKSKRTTDTDPPTHPSLERIGGEVCSWHPLGWRGRAEPGAEGRAFAHLPWPTHPQASARSAACPLLDPFSRRFKGKWNHGWWTCSARAVNLPS